MGNWELGTIPAHGAWGMGSGGTWGTGDLGTLLTGYTQCRIPNSKFIFKTFPQDLRKNAISGRGDSRIAPTFRIRSYSLRKSCSQCHALVQRHKGSWGVRNFGTRINYGESPQLKIQNLKFKTFPNAPMPYFQSNSVLEKSAALAMRIPWEET